MSKAEEDYKHFAETAKRAIKGEAFFESLVIEYSIPIQVIGLKDVGIDYICQWVVDDKPTEVLFAAQVKTFSSKTAKPEMVGKDQNNGLEEYRIPNSNFKLNKKDLAYWMTLGMPAYMFAIYDEGSKLTCYYKRFSRHLTVRNLEIDFKAEFYRVSDHNEFLAFADPERKCGGFARDLFIDYIRWTYSRGLLTYLNPRRVGLEQFSEGIDKSIVFVDILKPYLPEIRKAYRHTEILLKHLDLN
jgi:hypothetical protein